MEKRIFFFDSPGKTLIYGMNKWACSITGQIWWLWRNIWNSLPEQTCKNADPLKVSDDLTT
jgi:hypothetical protein